jgi:hypothetical protein
MSNNFLSQLPAAPQHRVVLPAASFDALPPAPRHPVLPAAPQHAARLEPRQVAAIVRAKIARTPHVRRNDTSATNAHLRDVLRIINGHALPNFQRQALRREVALKRHRLRTAYDTYRHTFGTSLAASAASKLAIIESARAEILARRLGRLPSPPPNALLQLKVASLPSPPTHAV